MQQAPPQLHSIMRKTQLSSNLPDGALLRVQVAGSSMQPTLRPGDTLLLERVAAAAVRPGDLLTVQIGSQLQTHRLLRCTASHLYMRGDACVQSDPPVLTGTLLGRVQQIERSGELPFAEPRWVRAVQLACSRVAAASIPLDMLGVPLRGSLALVRRGVLGIARWQQRSEQHL